LKNRHCISSASSTCLHLMWNFESNPTTTHFAVEFNHVWKKKIQKKEKSN